MLAYLSVSYTHLYKTKNGRAVKSGGGVSPDVATEDDKLSPLSAVLYSKNYFFDYATIYAKQHKNIAQASDFTLSAAEFTEFNNWLSGKDYACLLYTSRCV